MAAISINPLHDAISIVHVPVALAPAYATKLYWTIDRAATESTEFFNYTSNRVEIALFAASDLAEHEWGRVADPGIRVNGEWRVFEISSGDDGEASIYDSPHLRQVSAPLAAAGVSILWQSSYFTDYILVKSSDFVKASRIFASKGWSVDPIHTQPSHNKRRSMHLEIRDLPAQGFPLITPPPAPTLAEITVLASPLACVGLSKDGETRAGERIRKVLVWPERAVPALAQERSLREHDGHDGADAEADVTNRRQRLPRYNRPFFSYTCTEDGTSLLTEVRILRTLFSGELRNEVLTAGELERDTDGSDWLTDTDEGEWEDEGQDSGFEATSLMVGSPNIATPVQTTLPPVPSSPIRTHSIPGTPLDGSHGQNCPPALQALPIHWASTSRSVSASETSPTRSATPTSHSTPRSHDTRLRPLTTLSPTSSSPTSQLSAQLTASSMMRNSSLPLPQTHSHLHDTAAGRGRSNTVAEFAGLHSNSLSSTVRRASAGPLQATAVWGSGQSGQYLERLEGMGYEEASVFSDDDEDNEQDDHHSPTESSSSSEAGEPEPGERTMRCLQLDLRAVAHQKKVSGHGEVEDVHLHKSGLVTRFASVLHSAGVRMLYSSTTHTANILVEGRDVKRAERALREKPAS